MGSSVLLLVNVAFWGWSQQLRHCVTASQRRIVSLRVLRGCWADTDCDPECTGDLQCVFRRKLGGKVCRCKKGTQRQSPDSDVCLSADGSGGDNPAAPTDTPKKAETEAPAQTTGGGEPCNTQCDMNRRLLKLVNDFRAKNGKPPLCLNNKLIQAAKLHSDDTSKNNIQSHTGSDGSLYYTQNGIEGRIPRAGFELGDCPAHQDCDAENFAWNQPNEEVTFNAWVASPGHRANLLCNAMYVGAYVTNNYYTQDFASRLTEDGKPYYECNN